MKGILRIVLAVLTAVLLFAGIVRQPALTALPFRGTTRADARALREHVVFLTTAAAPRGAAYEENLDTAATYIEQFFRRSGARVAVQEFIARKRSYRNVIARFGPEDGSVMIVGAHYDAFSDTGHLPGADDNASGTAGLLELARLLGRSPPSSPVMLVAYSTEEPPFFGSEQMGSAIHAASLARERAVVAGMICLEMIGYYAEKQPWPNATFALLYPSRGDFIAVGGGWADRKLARRVKRAIRGAGGIRAYSFTGPRETLDASDHRNYWRAGWTAVLVTDTAYLRNPHYHTRGDTADTLDYTKMARVVDGVWSAVTR